MNQSTKVSKWHGGHRFIKDHKNTVQMSSKLGQLKPDSFIETAADTIATDGGFENLFRDNNTEALMMFCVGSIDQR